MKIISWNVNGIRAILKKDFLKIVEKENPDILCIQEIKANPDQVEIALGKYKNNYWNSAEKKGYSGTAIFSKIEPLSMIKGNKFFKDNEGRIITLEFEKFFLVNVYTPNSARGTGRLKYRIEWDKKFLKYLRYLEKTKPVIVCGDFNVARSDIELAHPKQNYNKTAGYMEEEIQGFAKYIKNGFIDTFREFNKKPEQYTYWSYRFKARQKNIGWRIDYFLVSKKYMKNIKKSFILNKILGSDHCPVGIEIK